MATEKETFATTNIELAAFLLVKKAGYIETKKTSFRQSTFYFSNPETCEKLRREFNTEAEAPAISLFDKRKFLMGEMRDNGNGDNYGQTFN